MNRTANRIMSFLSVAAAASGLLLALFWQGGEVLSYSQLELGTRIGLDPTGRAFLLFTSLLWLFSSIYGLGYLKSDPRRWAYDAFFLAAMIGNFGLILALDAVTFYTCFALMSFASYGLVIHFRDEFTLRAGKIYMILVVIGEVSLFAGLVGMVAGTGTNLPLPVAAGLVTSPITVALIVVGFGIKAGVVLLHVWLPLAHPAAPPPASAVLSGAMIKAGLIGWIRFLPLGEGGFEQWGTAMMAAGVISAFFGVAVGLAQKNPKAILAYSSISQMGFMTLGIGAGLAHPELWPTLLTAVTLYAVHHGLAKGALFLGAGAAPGGLSKFAWLGLILPALSLGGAPFLSGAAAKSALKSVSPQFSGNWPALLAILLPVAAIGTTLLMVRFLVVVRSYHLTSHTDKGRGGMFAGWGALVVGSLILFWLWEPGRSFANAATHASKLAIAAWPVATGIALAWAVMRWGNRSSAWIGKIPEGDLVVLFERIARKILQLLQDWQTTAPAKLEGLNFLLRIPPKAAAGEKALARWPTATLLLLVLLISVYSLTFLI